jgi:sterol desaturase/sphingolipid hydroxylase (fatty acid hydroxylase superfamily)
MNMALLQQIESARIWVSGSVLLLLLAWESFAPFFGFFKSRPGGRMMHGTLNILLWIINVSLIAVVFVRLWAATTELEFGLLQRLHLPSAIKAILAVMLLDLWTYWWHRMNHRIRFLWRFHRMHHSDPFMDVTSANRFHFGEIVFSSLLRVPVLMIIGADMWHIVLYEMLMFPVVQLHHANISLSEPIDRLLRVFVASPFMHKVHHSIYQPETDSNYSAFLSVWDRIFGSFRLNSAPESIQLGLDDFTDADQRLWGMIKTPLL